MTKPSLGFLRRHYRQAQLQRWWQRMQRFWIPHRKGITSRFIGTSQAEVQTVLKMKAFFSQPAPFAMVTISALERLTLEHFERIQLHLQATFPQRIFKSMQAMAGFSSPDEKQLTYFAKHFYKEAPKTDILGLEGDAMDLYLYQRYFSNTPRVSIRAFHPLLGGWLPLLQGKRVLVVSPIADQMFAQAQHQANLFPNERFPTFTVIPVKISTQHGMYSNWFDALDALKVNVMQYDFDVALIDASAFGSHLAWFIKTMGRQAIETGDETMHAFGLYRKQDRHHEAVKTYFNDRWQMIDDLVD